MESLPKSVLYLNVNQIYEAPGEFVGKLSDVIVLKQLRDLNRKADEGKSR